MHHLLFSARETYPAIVRTTPLDEPEWVSGARFVQPPPPLAFEFEAGPGFAWPDYLRPNSVIPLFSPAMQAALQRAGVDNIDYTPARVTDTATGEARDYAAANIIGLHAAMDRAASRFVPARRHPVMVRSIEHLVLDEAACAGLKLFRLAEYDLLVVIDDAVATALQAAGLQGVVVAAPADWDGFTD